MYKDKFIFVINKLKEVDNNILENEKKESLDKTGDAFSNGTLDLNKLEDAVKSKSQVNGENAILKINENDVDYEEGNINIDEFQYIKQSSDKKSKKKLNLGIGGLFEIHKMDGMNYWQIFILSFSIIVVSIISIIFFKIYDNYIKIASEQIIRPPYDVIIKEYDNYEEFVSKYVWFNDYYKYKYSSLLSKESIILLREIIDSNRLTYIQKKNIIQKNLDIVTSGILTNYGKLDEIKKDVTKYGFIGHEIYNLMQDKEQIISIKKSLLSLEVVKFSSAIRVFSYLDTFLESFANSLNAKPMQIQQMMLHLINRGEKDIYTYLSHCYLNPFEWSYDCNIINDFDYSYDIRGEANNLDLIFFKKLMQYIDLKLEQTEVPSFSIVFKDFDPKQEQITFTIDINTFQKDEIALTKNNILNPHMFVVIQLLNLLKQSKFIIGESINIRGLTITPKQIVIGNTQFVINSSKMNFTLPIQKTSEREIFDFVEKFNYDTNTVSMSLNTIEDEDLYTDDQKSTQNNSQDTIEDNMQDIVFDKKGQIISKFLDIQEDQATIRYAIKDKGKDVFVQELSRSIDLLINQGYDLNDISNVIEYIGSNEIWKKEIIDFSKLGKQASNGQKYIDIILEEMNKLDDIDDITVQSGLNNTGFWETRKIFEDQ